MTGHRWEDFIPERLVSLDQAGGRTRFGCGAMRMVDGLVQRFGRQVRRNKEGGRARMRQADGRVGWMGQKEPVVPRRY